VSAQRRNNPAQKEPGANESLSIEAFAQPSRAAGFGCQGKITQSGAVCLMGSPRGTGGPGPPPAPRRPLPKASPGCTSCSLFAPKGQSLLQAKPFLPWQGSYETERGKQPGILRFLPHTKCSSTSTWLLKAAEAAPSPAARRLFSSSLFLFFFPPLQ